MNYTNSIKQLLNTDSISDSQISSYVDESIKKINSHGKRTFYSTNNAPKEWTNVIILGAYVVALEKLTERQK